MDGKPKPGGIKTFSCPACGGTIGLRAVGISVTAICQHCSSVIDVANDNFRIIQQSKVKTRKIRLPIGTRGTLFGTEWEVVGFVSRTDETGLYFWREYLLFNPYQGFRFLVENQGHWNFVRLLRQNIAGNGKTGNAWFDDQSYRLFLRGGAKVEYVLGEFYWRVKVGAYTNVADYIAPPYMLSVETSEDEITWSQGLYVEREQIRNAFEKDVTERFGGDFSLPIPVGVAPNQPSPVAGRIKSIVSQAAIFVVTLIILQVIAATFADEKKIYDRTMRMEMQNKGKEIASEPFVLDKYMSNVQVELYSPVKNNWMEVGLSLVSENSNDSYNVLQGVEFYEGYDSDGYWSEGNRRSSTIISSVPGGTYRLLIEPDAGSHTSIAADPHVDYTLVLKRDVLVWSNFWAAVFLILLYPVILVIRHHNFEGRRWEQSDFEPVAAMDQLDVDE